MSASPKILIGLALAQCGWLISCASNGSSLFPIRQSGKYGYITKAGKVAINPQFDNVGKFSEGLAPVKMGKVWGYIDSQGKLVINPQFDVADRFAYGLALVASGYRH